MNVTLLETAQNGEPENKIYINAKKDTQICAPVLRIQFQLRKWIFMYCIATDIHIVVRFKRSFQACSSRLNRLMANGMCR